MTDDFAGYIHNELTRLYLEETAKKFIRSDYLVTQEEVEAFNAKLDAERELNRTMALFVNKVANWPPANIDRVVMNTQHLNWIRAYHQKYQKLGIYTGRKKRAGMNRATPSLYGVPIRIDETATEPRLE